MLVSNRHESVLSAINGSEASGGYGILTTKASSQNVSGANVQTLITWDTQTDDMSSNVWTCPSSLDGKSLIVSCRCHISHEYDNGGSGWLTLFHNGSAITTPKPAGSYWVSDRCQATSYKLTVSEGDTLAMYGKSADTGSRINISAQSYSYWSIQENVAS